MDSKKSYIAYVNSFLIERLLVCETVIGLWYGSY